MKTALPLFTAESAQLGTDHPRTSALASALLATTPWALFALNVRVAATALEEQLPQRFAAAA